MTRADRGLARLRVWETIGLSYRLTLGRLGSWVVITAVLQGAVLLLAVPALQAVFGTALAASGISSLTLDTAARFFTSPGSIALFVLLTILALVALLIQAAVFTLAAAMQQSSGRMPAPRVLIRKVFTRLRELARPSTLLLIPYGFLIAPLGHAGLGSVLSNWLSVPNFIGGELSKTTGGAITYAVLLILVWYVNLRLILVVPFAIAGDATVAQAFRLSWNATGWVPWRTVLLILGVVIPLTVASIALAASGLVVTALAEWLGDLAGAADAAPAAAAVAFALVQVVLFFLFGLALAIQAHCLVALVRSVVAVDHAPESVPISRRTKAIARTLVAAGAAGAVAILAVTAFPALDRIDDGETFVLGHRGFPSVAVENTIPSLEAAHEAGADIVEFDVQQTKDGDWVVMHDFNLKRLTGQDVMVRDLTLDELTAMEVTAEGHTDPIPSMREWVRRAKELDQQLLIEIKPNGGETPDYLESFFRILDEEGVAESSLYHSLSADVVAGQKAMRPELPIGYIVSVNIGGLPETPADFIVVEEWSYSTELRDAAWDAGKSVFVWTVNDADPMRGYLREPVDGLITDHPNVGLAQRETVADDQSLAAKLLDHFDRLVTVF